MDKKKIVENASAFFGILVMAVWIVSICVNVKSAMDYRDAKIRQQREFIVSSTMNRIRHICVNSVSYIKNIDDGTVVILRGENNVPVTCQ